MSDFFENYKHPKWQKKRLEILERADFKCENCGESEEELSVHHGYYEKGKKPWEYNDFTFTCLCDPCHEQAEEHRKGAQRLAGHMSPFDVPMVCGYALGILLDGNAWYVEAGKLSKKASDGIADSWGINRNAMWNFVIGEESNYRINGAALRGLRAEVRSAPRDKVSA